MGNDFHEKLPAFKGTSEEQLDQVKDWIIHHSTWVDRDWTAQRKLNIAIQKHCAILETRLDMIRRYFWMGVGFCGLAAAIGAAFGPALARSLVGG